MAVAAAKQGTPTSWAPHPISKAEPPCGGNSFCPLVSAISFLYDPKLVTRGEGWNVAVVRSCKSSALPSGSAPSSPQRTGAAPALLQKPPPNSRPRYGSRIGPRFPLSRWGDRVLGMPFHIRAIESLLVWPLRWDHFVFGDPTRGYCPGLE